MKLVQFTFLLALASCSQQQSNDFLQLEMYGEHEAALYIITDEGEISYGGGMAALVGDTSWHGQLSKQQLNELSSIIFKSKMKSEKQDLQQRFVIKIFDEHPIEVSWDHTGANHLYKSLQAMTSSRYSEILESLPKPSTKIIIDRSVEGERFKVATDQSEHQSDE